MAASNSVAEERLTRKGRETRERIVEAAALLMFEHGVAGTKTSDVQQAAGVSGSQLYHYFEDKMALVRAVIAFQTEAVLANQQPFLGRLDSIAGLRTWRDMVVGYQQMLGCAGGCPIGALASELAETDPQSRELLVAGFARWEDAIREGLRAMHERGELAIETHPDDLALATLAALQGGILLCQVRRETAPLEASLDAMIDHIESLVR